MMRRSEGTQIDMLLTSIEDLIPEDHFLRKLEKAMDFSFVYDELQAYYCTNNGRYSTDPVVIVKSLLIGFLYGINSERRLEQELQYNIAYRWFLGLSFGERAPDHSTISQLRRRKFNDTDIFKKLFVQVLRLCAEAGLVSGSLLVTDSTHIKASASKSSKVKVEIEQEATKFFAELDRQETVERERLGLPAIDRKPLPVKKSEQTRSTTDSEAGWLKRPDKPEGFHYLSHQTLDADNGIVIDVIVTAGNTPDNVPYLEQIKRAEDILQEYSVEIEAVCADSSYDTAIIHKNLDEAGITAFMPLKGVPGRTKVEYKRETFTYNRENDKFICPNGKLLNLRNLMRADSGIYREYRTFAKDCKSCPHRSKCLAPSQSSRKLLVHIYQDIVDKHHAADGTKEHKDALNKRQIWCEGTFAAQKSQHNLKQLYRRGLRAAAEHCFLSACAINLKRLIKCRG